MAIAFDSASNGSSGTSTTISWTHTVSSNTNGVLFMAISANTGVTVSNVKYGGVAMTALLSNQEANTQSIWVYYLFAPSTGANTATFDATGAGQKAGCSSAYTGVLQSGMPDNSTTSGFHPSGADSTLTLSPVASNCWGINIAGWNGLYTITGGTGITKRAANTAGSVVVGIGDTNATISGSTSTALHSSSSDWYAAYMASFAPAAGGGAVVQPRKALLGVGV